MKQREMTISRAQRWLREDEAATYVGMSPGTLEHRRRAGNGPAWRKIGRAVVYDVEDLSAWMASFPRQTDPRTKPRKAAAELSQSLTLKAHPAPLSGGR